MTGPEAAFDQTASAPTMSIVPEDRPAPKAPTKGGQSSTGACDACRIKKVRPKSTCERKWADGLDRYDA